MNTKKSKTQWKWSFIEEGQTWHNIKKHEFSSFWGGDTVNKVTTSCPSSGLDSKDLFTLFSSLTGSRDLRNLGVWGVSTLKGLELKKVGLSGGKPVQKNTHVVIGQLTVDFRRWSQGFSSLSFSSPWFSLLLMGVVHSGPSWGLQLGLSTWSQPSCQVTHSWC